LAAKVRYLVDTNIWLNSEVVSEFLKIIPPTQIFVSDFAIHSIGVILGRLKKMETLKMFLNDLFINGQIEQLVLEPLDLIDVADNINKYSLDFDDSYQYTVAEKYGLILVTFDKDFKIAGLKKKTPQEIIGK
jgi:predicted nucleic acid-binding protein